MKYLALVLLSAAVAVSAYGQAIIEYSLGTARSGVAGAAAGKSGKGAAAVFDKTGRALQKAGNAPSSRPAAAARPATAAARAAAVPAAGTAKKDASAPTPAPAPVNPDEVTVGLERQELITKFGKPSMKITNVDGSEVVEKFWYRAAGREPVVVILRDGKVSGIAGR